MTAHETALKFALLKVLSTRLGDAKKVADGQIREGWQAGDRNAAVLPDGTKLGSITLAKGKATSRVSDEDALLAWVLETYPEEIEQVQITQVKPTFVEQLKSYARQAGEPIDPATGETVPGLEVAEGTPYPTTRLNADAAERIAQAWRDGSLTELLASLVQPAVEGGEQQ